MLHLFTSRFFTTDGDLVTWKFFDLCKNINRTRNYNWAKAIIDFHMHYADTSQPPQVKGCNAMILYWLCERRNLLRPTQENLCPRFLKCHSPTQPLCGMTEQSETSQPKKFLKIH